MADVMYGMGPVRFNLSDGGTTMRPITALAAVILLSTSACGGGSDDVTGTNTGTGPMSASIDGKAFSSIGPAAQYKNNVLAVTGLDLSSSTAMSVGVSATGPGTFSFALGGAGTAIAIVSKGTQSWSTAATGGAGTLTLTTLTANHVVGTFSFDAVSQTGGAVTHVTNGKIDITF
jgi:hypothetical protein